MNVLFTRLAILSAVWMILGSASPAPATAPANKQTFYYWYWTDDDSYLNYCTTSTEITDLQNQTGKLVNTQAGGGTLIAAGYNNNNYPHTLFPAVHLYTH